MLNERVVGVVKTIRMAILGRLEYGIWSAAKAPLLI